MRPRQVGGWLIVGGGVAVGLAILRYLTGGGVSFGSANASGLLIDAALALFGSGALVLGVAGSPPLDGRLARIGLGSLALGQLSLLALSVLLAASSPESALSLPIYTVGLFVVVAASLGLLLIGLGLARLPGLPRLIGVLVLAGALLLAGGLFAEMMLRLDVLGRTLLWAIVVAPIVGNVGVGLLAIRLSPVAAEDSSPT